MKKFLLSSCGSAIILVGALGATPALADSNPTVGVTSTLTSSSSASSPAKTQLTSRLAEEAKVSKEQAISIASHFIKLPSGYKESNVSFNTNWYPDHRSVWEIDWNKNADQETGNIHITVDANSGDVLAYNRYENNPGKPASYPPKVSQDQAVSIAKSFIAKQFPDKANEVTYEAPANQKPPLKGNVQYNLRFLRIVNNIPFENNYINVTVDGNGTITGMDYRWDQDLTFPSTQGMLSQEQANSILQKTLPFELHYITLEGIIHPLPAMQTDPQSPKIVLAYSHLGNFSMIDAKTGKWVDGSGNVQQTPSAKLTPLADHPLASPPSGGVEMTQSQAENKVKSELDFPSGLTLQNAGYNDKWGSENVAVWNFNWVSQDQKTSLSATLNAKTGELLNFNYSDPDLYGAPPKDWQPSVTYDQAKQTAIDSLKKWVPYKMNDLVFDAQNNSAPPPQVKSHLYHFNFERVVNGIPVSSQSVHVSVSADTGRAIAFYQNWNSNVAFPDAKKAVSLSDAKGPYLSHFTFKPLYKLIQPNPGTGTMGSTNSSIKPKITLVYQLTQESTDQPVYFDATQNKWLSQRTGEAVDQNTKATDISGSWAEKPLQLMLDYGAIQVDKNGKVYPNALITRGQMIKMLLLATNPDPIYYEKMAASSSNSQAFSDVGSSSPYYNYVQVAAQRGWIDTKSKDFKPNEPVTREDLADLIVHALNYNKLADVKGLFNLDFNDSGKITKKGDVAIVSHLGIMVGSNHDFHPQEKATKAQAAVAFYNFLKAQGKYGN